MRLRTGCGRWSEEPPTPRPTVRLMCFGLLPSTSASSFFSYRSTAHKIPISETPTTRPRLSILRFERDQNKISLWPLCSYSYDASTQRSITNVLWSTLRYQSTPTSYELKVTHSHFHLTCESELDDQSLVAFQMLWRFVWVKKESNGSYLASINPFFYYEHSPDTGSWTAFLGGLIAREKSPTGHSKMAYFWLF